jgi:hypothetical protein
LEAYPNPARDQVTISFQSALVGQGRIIVSDFSGRTVILQAMECFEGFNTLLLNTETLSSGLYNITLESQGGQVQHMLMIE